MLTILTPVYNRAYIIDNLYRSLLRQSDHDFDWLIVDDGSTDDLKEHVSVWDNDPERFFEMKYLYRENGGKHRAWNTALPYIKGDWTFVVDSDDYLTDDAVSSVREWIAQIEDDASFGGVSGRRGKPSNGTVTPIGTYPAGKDYVDATNLKRWSNHLMGDMAEVYRTELLRRYPFPEFEGEKFCSEGAVLSRIACAGYRVRWFPKVIYICDYLPDGLMHNVFSNRLDFFQGYTFVIKNCVKYDEFPINDIEIGNYSKVAKMKGFNLREGAGILEISLLRYCFCIILSKLNDMRVAVKHGRTKRR